MQRLFFGKAVGDQFIGEQGGYDEHALAGDVFQVRIPILCLLREQNAIMPALLIQQENFIAPGDDPVLPASPYAVNTAGHV